MSEIFISYSPKDSEVANLIAEALRPAGLSVWRERGILASDFAAATQGALDSAKCVILIWSKSAALFQGIQQDIRRAIQAWSRNRLLLVALDDTPLPVGLRDIRSIPIGGGSDSGMKELVVRAMGIARPQPPRALVPEPPSIRRWRKRSALLPVVAALGIAVVSGVWVWFSTSSPPLPPDIASGHTVSPNARPQDWLLVAVAVIVIAVIVGAVLGAATVWAWSGRAHRKRLPAVALTERASPDGLLQVFVSYSHEDTEIVDRLVDQIEKVGYPVWIDREAPGAQRFAGPIVDAIRSSKLVALMCSRNAFASDHVIREIYVAGDFKKPFIAFQLDLTNFPDDVLYFVSGFPRIPIASVNARQLQSEIARMVAA
jgi:hypothetical protein